MKKEIFLVPYAHLDTQWRWEFPTTIKKYIKRTLDKNFELLDRYPEYRFNFTGAIRYAMMKEYYPEQFERVKDFVNEGRWSVIGTCLDETDAIVPSVESMIRNILYGDQWAVKELGTTSRDYVIPDCFGFPANMPTVLAHCGIHGFSSQKLKWNSAVGIPFEIGVWKGPDGSEMVSALNPGPYNSHLLFPIYRNSKRLKKLKKLGEKTGIWKSYQYYGVGDIGGAPSEGSVKRAIKSIKFCEERDVWYTVRQGSSDQFFSEITEEEQSKLDRYAGDLLLVNHSAGMLTSAAIMKRWNRKNEIMAHVTEVAAVTALLVAGSPYPAEKIKSIWTKVIGNQMHDILPGTCTPIAYEYSQNDEVVALKAWTSIIDDAASVIAPFVKGEGKLLLFNPLGEHRHDVLDIELLGWDEKNGSNAIAEDANGQTFPVQIQKNERNEFQATFSPELQPFSWSRFSITPNDQSGDKEITDRVKLSRNETEYILENSYYRVKISKDGKIESIYHKILEQELLRKPLAYEFQKEAPKLFPAWNMHWEDRKKPPFLRIEGGETVSIIEQGPIRSTIQIKATYNESIFLREISLSQNSEIVEFIERIKWRETGCSLKLALNASLQNPELTYNWETSRIKRGLNRENQFEVPSRFWADISEDRWGISLIEDSKYGYDHPRPDTLRMTLLYTPTVGLTMPFKDQASQDWGEHTIRYGIYGHSDKYENTDYFAKCFNQRVQAFLIDNDVFSGPKETIGLFEISNKQLGVLAVKKAEGTDGILIRVFERYGKSVEAELSFKFDVESVQEVNGLEEFQSNVEFRGNKFSIKMDANEIRSYIVALKKNDAKYKIKQQSLRLDYNFRLVGRKGESQVIFPAEITPASIKSGSISYNIEVDQDLNALQCKAQKISIPEGSNVLSLLIGSREDTEVSFNWADGNGNPTHSESYHVPSMTNFIGQWDTRIWKKKPKRHLKYKRDYLWLNKCVGVENGYVRREKLAWYSTHTYKDGKIQPYHYGYLFEIILDIPSGQKFILLPDDPNVYVVAVTASQQDIRIKNVRHLQDKYDF